MGTSGWGSSKGGPAMLPRSLGGVWGVRQNVHVAEGVDFAAAGGEGRKAGH